MVIKKEQVTEVLDILEQMYPDAGCELDYDSLFHLIVAVALSAQTTDVSVNKVTPQLFDKYPEPCDLARADQKDVEELIRTIGLYKNKSKNIIRMAQMIAEEFDGNVPEDRENLERLPGVGHKTANVVLAEGLGKQTIAVDTHVFRVANRIGLCDEKDVTATEKALMKRIPEERWTRSHHLLIFHGRRCCNARKPACDKCMLAKMCIYYANKNNVSIENWS